MVLIATHSRHDHGKAETMWLSSPFNCNALLSEYGASQSHCACSSISFNLSGCAAKTLEVCIIRPSNPDGQIGILYVQNIACRCTPASHYLATDQAGYRIWRSKRMATMVACMSCVLCVTCGIRNLIQPHHHGFVIALAPGLRYLR